MNIKTIAALAMIISVAPCFGMEKIKDIFSRSGSLEKAIDKQDLEKVKKALKSKNPLQTNNQGITYFAQNQLLAKADSKEVNAQIKNMLLEKMPHAVSEEDIKKQIFQCCKVCPTGQNSPVDKFIAECAALKHLASNNQALADDLSKRVEEIIRESDFLLKVNHDYRVIIKTALNNSAK